MDVFDTLVAQFGAAAKDSLNGPGELEAALATPVDNLLREYGENILSRKVVLHAEVREDWDRLDGQQQRVLITALEASTQATEEAEAFVLNQPNKR